MYKYFATFSPGFEEYIVKTLEENIKDGEIISSQESSVTFKSSLPYEKIEKLRYLANIYLLVGSPVHSNVPDTAFVKLLNNNADYAVPQKHPHPTKLKTYRVMVQKGNQLIGITKAVTDKIKEKIVSLFFNNDSQSRIDSIFHYFCDKVLLISVFAA